MKGEMPTDPTVAEWVDVRGAVTPTTHRQVFGIVTARAGELADLFYSRMFEHPRAAAMLDHAVVKTRLNASMRRWMLQLFDPEVAPERIAQVQRITGEVHARVGVPIDLVSMGARVLTREIAFDLASSPLSGAELVQAMQYVHEVFALAIDGMTLAFQANTNRMTRSEEAYRLFFIGQDMKAERERRRSELLEWSHQILSRYYWDEDHSEAPQADPSQFGLWLQHKASMLFDGCTEVDQIRAEVEAVERRLLPQLAQVRANRADARSVVADIHRHVESIKLLLGAMFDRFIAVEDGRDSVTTLLSRRYFPAVAKREIELARAQGHTFAVLMIDLDGLRHLTHAHGHDAGNRVLVQAAQRLQEHVRAGDFSFRIGDDEFIVLLVETAGAEAMQVAEGLRRRFENTPFQVGSGNSVAVHVSIGVAQFDGHPDYQRLLDRADGALRQAKAEGGNRCRQGD